MSKTTKQHIIERLSEIAQGTYPEHYNKALGLCHHVTYDLEVSEIKLAHEILKGTFKSWDEFSGSDLYPVSPERADISATEAFYTYTDVTKGEYGQARCRLAKHVVDTLIQELS